MDEVRIDEKMSLSVTRCPNCGSTFNISQRQLETSGGQARCGACLHVFLATDNLVEPGGETDPADSVFIGRAPEEQEATDDEPLALPEVESRFEALPEDRRASLEQFRSTVQLRKRNYVNWAAFFGYSTLALALLALLAAQYLWRYMPVYSQVDWLRPGYAQLCALAGCELPDDANAMSRCEIPVAFMIVPARMNSGMAISGNLVAPENMTSPTFGIAAHPPSAMIATTDMTPSATAMGTLITIRTTNRRIRAIVTGASPLRLRVRRAAPRGGSAAGRR